MNKKIVIMVLAIFLIAGLVLAKSQHVKPFDTTNRDDQLCKRFNDGKDMSMFQAPQFGWGCFCNQECNIPNPTPVE